MYCVLYLTLPTNYVEQNVATAVILHQIRSSIISFYGNVVLFHYSLIVHWQSEDISCIIIKQYNPRNNNKIINEKIKF